MISDRDAYNLIRLHFGEEMDILQLVYSEPSERTDEQWVAIARVLSVIEWVEEKLKDEKLKGEFGVVVGDDGKVIAGLERWSLTEMEPKITVDDGTVLRDMDGMVIKGPVTLTMSAVADEELPPNLGKWVMRKVKDR